jgi:hypothetical protein
LLVDDIDGGIVSFRGRVLWAASSRSGLLLNINTSSVRGAIVPSYL